MISGFFAPGILPQPLIRIAVSIPELGVNAAFVPFIVDTGAAFTVIHAMDSMRYFGATPAMLDPATWLTVKTVGGVGGSLFCKEVTASYGFRHDDTTLEVIHGTIHIGDIKSASTPSLLGWDLLKFFNMTVRGAEQILTLERAVP